MTTLLVIGIVLFIIFVVVGIVFMIKEKSKKAAEQKVEADKKAEELAAKTNIHLRDAEVGDILAMKGIGSELEDVSFKIEGLHTYLDEEGNGWAEAYGDGGAKPVFVEFIEDDEIEIFVKIGKMALTPEKVGVTEDDLWKIDEEEDGVIEYDDEKWEYDDSGSVTFFKDGEGDGEEFYSWDFKSEDGLRSLSFEKYGSKIECGICTKVDYRQISLTRE